MSVRVFILSALIATGIAISPSIAQQRELRVFNWSDYIDPKVLEQFSRETGIKVTYDTYDSNERLETRLLAGNTGYDIVVPSGTFLQRQIKAGLYQKIDRSRLRNAGQIWKEIDERLAAYDPGNEFSINYMWFTTGLAYNVQKVREQLGPDAVGSWDILFDENKLSKLAGCGVYVLDSPEDMFAIAMKRLGLDPDAVSRDNLTKATSVLEGLRKHVKKFHSSEYINALANGDICLAVAWAGDAYQARNRAAEAKKNYEIAYVIPREGTLMSMDNLAILKDAKNVEAAYAFIDFLLRPEIAAQNTRITNFANGVAASRQFIPPEIAGNPSIYPDAETMKRIFTVQSRDGATQRLIARNWLRVKTGR
ncbi:MAG: polyamine ABC transporter substrate-binding protein [Alphaproteobacteria bacterium]|nr:polyamine ABC transporter substrate-binding protein [Alphaproteobacteria bacterium]